MIKIPCPSCGCQYCDAKTTSGEIVKIDICRCKDGIDEFDITIKHCNTSEILYEKHQTESELVSSLSNRFNIDLNSMSHKCFN